ncbi:MAG: DUF1653 domain-containing protein [Clostridium sp.]|uniref:DUF1653 domain-containing protein n=1 Tax=Clostridium sp. TaxID=1506 RepID=UPI003EE72633
MNNKLKELIHEECSKANNFIEIPGIYRHFKKEKDGEDMIYAVSNISIPVSRKEIRKMSDDDNYKILVFYHTELERPIPIIRQGDSYYHLDERDREKLVIYTGLYGTRDTYVRPISMFLSKVDTDKYPNVTQTYILEII